MTKWNVYRVQMNIKPGPINLATQHTVINIIVAQVCAYYVEHNDVIFMVISNICFYKQRIYFPPTYF